MAKWSGNPDPNGNSFDGQGYTGSMLTHLPHIPLRNAWRGDLAVFGAYPGLHVVALLQGGSQDADPAVASHGSGPAPAATRYPRWRRSSVPAFSSPTCSFAPTPAERLSG